ncbi:MAG: DUF2309 domain-containing protein [Oleiphilaceae bacterium]|nr:DUF2309 domain-containing protein [Oleiphilaceae bacterium]
MNQPVPTQPAPLSPEKSAAINRAGARIAPTWPLDRLIAVNPWWGLRDQPFSDASARLSLLGRVSTLMPAGYYRDAWEKGRISGEDLLAVVADSGLDMSVTDCLAALDHTEPEHWLNVSDLLDADTSRQGKMAWRDEITHQLSQFCADFFQRRADDQSPDALYRAWRETLTHDAGLAIQMGEPGLMEAVAELPQTSEEALGRALTDLDVPPEHSDSYAHALLLDINGWASWVAYEHWEGNLNNQPHNRMSELIAIRMAWDWLLWRHMQRRYPEKYRDIAQPWRHQLSRLPMLLTRHRAHQSSLWIWQAALERAYQQPLFEKLSASQPGLGNSRPRLQAVFCIDVRSEVLRRALEAQDRAIQTLGFAGFFGLPIAYRPAGSDYDRPQLPGLLAPGLRARRSEPPKRAGQLARSAGWARWTGGTPSTFAFVESAGLAYAAKLLKNSLMPSGPGHPIDTGAETGDWVLEDEQGVLDASRQAGLAAGILGPMGLTRDFADRVLLVGHGSHSANNPHAAGLDCGACGGQSGEVNVRVLAQILNAPQVRSELAAQGIEIPESTRFVAAVHNTMTDDIDLFDSEPLPADIQGWLVNARRQTQRERAPDLGLAELTDKKLDRALRRRGRDWAQVRPEWGLAGNAAFLIAPRARSRHLNLGGRCFLHDYDWESDSEGRILETLMTAPMVVTNWINLQYYASVTDPLKYGSGNKVLHNVVGGNIGVFEGNGGDLRIGLPLQSVHNGTTWQHEPLRLTVVVAAPAERITGILERHETVRNLVENDWLHLVRWDDNGQLSRYRRGQWEPV